MTPFNVADVVTTFMFQAMVHVVLRTGSIYRLKMSGDWHCVCYLPTSG